MTVETAYAKLNLALHIRRRREDGYHELETLFAFLDAGDRLTARPAAEDRVETVGEFARGIAGPDNLVARALARLSRSGGMAVTLEKTLPVAAGLGGGSADAGAVFRLVEAAEGLPDDWIDRAAALGADVPACVRSETCLGHGSGTDLSPVVNDLAGTPALLVNPRVAVPTGPVFAAWDGVDRGALPSGSASHIAREGRNDLETPAITRAPVIAEVLSELAATGGWLTRMSGSGATCFALYADPATRDAAAATLAARRPGWWQLAGALR